ncbi:MAG: hypothetical protein EBU08_23585, partial [Micrococcales bacterium]|nr:hypothetical protein [Micrococcales bacterium]
TAAQNAAGPRQTKGAPVAKPTAATKPQFGTTTPKGSSVTSTGVSGLSAADRSAYSAGGGNAAAQKGMGSSTAQVIAQGKKNLGRMDQGKPAPPGSRPTSGSSSVHSTTGLSAYSAGSGSGSGSGGFSSSGGAAKPAAAPTAPVKPAASAVPKPAASSANPMDTWARSNPGLARKVANSSTPQAGKSVISARVNADNDRGPSTPTPSSSSSSTTSGSSSSSGETDRLKKALDIKKSDVTSSYEWSSVKTLKNIADAYSSVYEKKEYEPSRDKDGDGDNDFADNMIARMVASGMSREEAIKKVKNKSYNKKDGLDEATAMAKRGHDETAIRNKIAKSTGGGDAADRATALA